MEGADVVHVRADVRVRRVEGRLRPHGRVPLGGDPNEGDVGESRRGRYRWSPAETHTKGERGRRMAGVLQLRIKINNMST